MSHAPVMLDEVLHALSPCDGQVYVDGTFGGGGYTRAFLEAAPGCSVIAIDRDPDAEKRAEDFRAEYGARFEFIRGCFGDVAAHLQGRRVDGFVLDLGVSSFQLDQRTRGFSFREDGPLDMRMDPTSGQSAAELVNSMEENPLADVIYQYGEERKSRRVAKAIVMRRAEQKFENTLDLANVVRGVVPASKDGIDPATRTFQALRIAVNDELGEAERALDAAAEVLNPGGRLVVVSFHSLEDRLVKSKVRALAGQGTSVSRYQPDIGRGPLALFDLPSRKAVPPSEAEIATNPRARSAKMRVAVRNDAQQEEADS